MLSEPQPVDCPSERGRNYTPVEPVRCVLPEAPCRERMIARSTMTVKRSLKELEDAGLILRVRQGFGEPNKIYVLIPKKEDSRL